MKSGRKPIVGVMGGSSVPHEVEDMAYKLGTGIAKNGWLLLNGGRAAGVMYASARGAHEAGGLVVGVLPTRDLSGMCVHVDIPIRTGMGDARNVVNILSSDMVVALPGGAGTLSEVALALKNGKHVVLLGLDPGPLGGEYESRGKLVKVETVDEALVEIERHLLELVI